MYHNKIKDSTKVEFILRVKPYNDIDHEEAHTVQLEVKKEFHHLFSNTYDFELDEDIVKDYNKSSDNLITRVQDKHTNEHYTLKIINF